MEILLVDDEKDFRDVLTKRLSRRGVKVIEASHGEEALKILDETPIDIVVLDVKMPGMDGLSTLRHIKVRLPQTEVILLTGKASTQDGVNGIKAGAFDYLTKPIEIEHLLRKILQAHDQIQRARSELREAEIRERIKQQMVVAERLVALGTMATGVAHEINNPIAIIQESAGWLRQVLMKPEMENIPRKADFELGLDRIQRSVERAGRITQQLLQVVRTQSRDALEPDRMSDVPLRDLAQECIALVALEAKQKEIGISLGEQSNPTVWTDPFPLTQVLLNLLTNSIQATPRGGQIEVALASMVEVATIVIRDTGCGISEDNLKKIFEPFFTTKTVGQGTGMGLYVSWGIINRLGGMIDVESELGVGTTFTITLPIKR